MKKFIRVQKYFLQFFKTNPIFAGTSTHQPKCGITALQSQWVMIDKGCQNPTFYEFIIWIWRKYEYL